MTSRPIEQYFRHCPDCGRINPNCGVVPFRCSHCGYAHFFGPVAGVGGLIVNASEQLLLVRRARDPGKGKWGLPGGFVDPGETVEQALQRETQEETQLEICEHAFLMTFPNRYNYRGILIPVIDLFFVCRVTEPHRLTLQANELTDFAWVQPTPEHLAEMAFPSNRLAVEKWMSASVP